MSPVIKDTHVDLRIKRTHKLLWTALMGLLAERDLESISVSDICEQAMVHRTTFYKHYRDKHDLLLKGIGEMHDMLTLTIKKTEQVKNNPQFFVHVFIHIAEHAQFYKTMLCGDSISSFQNLMRRDLAERTENKLYTLINGQGDLTVPIPLVAQFCAGVILSTTAWWLEQNMPYTPEEMAAYVAELIADGSHTMLGLPPFRLG